MRKLRQEVNQRLSPAVNSDAAANCSRSQDDGIVTETKSFASGRSGPGAKLKMGSTAARYKGHPSNKALALKNIKYLRDQKARGAYLRRAEKAARESKAESKKRDVADDSDGEVHSDAELEQLFDPIKSRIGGGRLRKRDTHRLKRSEGEPVKHEDSGRRDTSHDATSDICHRAKDSARKPKSQEANIFSGAIEELDIAETEASEELWVTSSAANIRSSFKEKTTRHQGRPETRKMLYAPYEKAMALALARQERREEAARNREERRQDDERRFRAAKKRRLGEKRSVLQKTRRGQIVMGNVVERLLRKGGF